MNDTKEQTPGGGRVCPAKYAGWLSVSLRGLFQNPESILRGLVREGDNVADLGCGPGFFTLPLARMVGAGGKVAAVDLQEAMLEKMLHRAGKAGLLPRIRPLLCTADSLGDVGPVDFALAFYMAHETSNVARFMSEVSSFLAQRGRLLLVEPKFHVSAGAYERTVELARAVGLQPVTEPRIAFSRATLFVCG